jgi:hypothetical protein
MARRKLIYLVTVVALLATMTVTILTVPFLSPAAPDQTVPLKWVLGASPLSTGVRLFPDSRTTATVAAPSMARAFDITDVGGVSKIRYLKNTDGSTEEIRLKADGEHYLQRETYYPLQPHELGRRRHVEQFYAVDTDLVFGETILRLDGTLQEHTVNGANGLKHLIGYGVNGQTIVHDLIVDPREDQWSQPVLSKEQRWRDNAAHSLEYSNILDLRARTRTITYWGEDQRPLKVISSSSYAVNNGTITTAYFPGTDKIRMQSTVDSIYNYVKYFRFDGTVDHILKLCPGSTIIQYMDASGKVALLEQNWDRRDKTENGKTTSTYKISMVSEEDASGIDTRKIYFTGGPLSAIDIFNVEMGGVKYGEIAYQYDQASKTVEAIHYWIGKADHQMDREETHKPDEKIAGPAITPEEVTMRVNPDEDEGLLMPDPMDGPD